MSVIDMSRGDKYVDKIHLELSVDGFNIGSRP